MTAPLLAVVGTDTGVGKTVIGAGLLQGLRARGLNVAAYKPVETGIPTDAASLLAIDTAVDLRAEDDGPTRHVYMFGYTSRGPMCVLSSRPAIVPTIVQKHTSW